MVPVAFRRAGRRPASHEGGALSFECEVTRRHRENLLVVSTDYEQPFGSFTGELPHAGGSRGPRGDGAAQRPLVTADADDRSDPSRRRG